MVEGFCTIVLMTDNPEFDKQIRSYLSEYDSIKFEIISVASVSEGKEVLHRIDSNVVLIDGSLKAKPSNIILQITSEFNTIPVILLLDSKVRDKGITAIRQGAQDYLFHEELNSEKLTCAIVNSIERKKILRQITGDKPDVSINENRYKKIADISNHGIIILDKNNIVQYTNKKARALFGYDDFNTSGFEFPYKFKHNNTLTLSKDVNHQVKVLETSVEYLHYDDWKTILYIYDLTEQLKSKRDLQQTANVDQLTKLYNRHFFDKSINRIFEKCKKNETMSFALCIIDCDNFKFVNDTFGHDAGDELLRVVSSVLIDIVRPTDIVARIGGDEFAIILDNIESASDAEMLCRRIVHSFKDPLSILHHTINTSMSIGVAHFNAEYESVEEIFKSADTALYQAKQLGKNQHAVFSGSPKERNSLRFSFDNHVKKAIDQEEFTLTFQPIVRPESKRIVSIEPLIRWNSQESGKQAPKDFISQALRNGVITDIDSWAITNAFERLKQIRVSTNQEPKMHLNLNLSLQSICSNSIVALLEDMIKSACIESSEVIIELDFGEYGKEKIESKLYDAIATLKEKGFQILLDNFGASSCDTELILKIKPQFVELDIDLLRKVERSDYYTLVKRMIDFCHDMDVQVIAEGIESQTEFDLIKKAGADFMKGNFFSDLL